MVLKRLLFSLWELYVTIGTTAEREASSIKVKVEFYGEAKCPFCRKFVTEAWPMVWKDPVLKELVDYSMFPWGNAYFSTQTCGGGPYSPETRHCWYTNCVDVATPADPDCFEGEAVYQHGPSEGALDIYEACVINELGMDTGVEFAACIEGPNMELYDHNVTALVETCLSCGHCLHKVNTCVSSKRGKELEVQMAKATPDHPGVPYIVVNGNPLDDDDVLDIKKIICEAAASSQADRLKSCNAAATVSTTTTQ